MLRGEADEWRVAGQVGLVGKLSPEVDDWLYVLVFYILVSPE